MKKIFRTQRLYRRMPKQIRQDYYNPIWLSIYLQLNKWGFGRLSRIIHKYL